MSNSTLLGSNYVSEAEVFNVPAVPFTKTFHPVHHRDFITVVKEAVTAVGMNIIKQEFVLAGKNQEKMFGVFDLNHGSSELCWSIGLRNSMDKSFSLSLTSGTRVFVCQNLCFSGEFLAVRRHTSSLDIDELAFMAFRAMRQMIPRLQKFQKWHEGLRNFSLPTVDMKILLVEIMTNRVIPPSKFCRFNDLYANVYDDSLWGFHETVTDILKGSNLIALPKKNMLLNQVIDRYIDSLDSAKTSPLGDFYQNRSLLSR
ncbi:hypothetical protein [Desulfopila inferna]|uniref:hypothetical protein n=1 Tax=Desulfopila inferna TaxID=468528 RepID=UPI0019642A71|nr:hypothetical protein [Desulfopila inferna]MBM9606739.1 hypothetical protein [Desulfopila inferna]